MTDIRVDFTVKDLQFFYDATGDITTQDDFEDQDDAYKDYIIDLELRLYKALMGAK